MFRRLQNDNERVGRESVGAQILHEDSYYCDRSELEFSDRELINYDHPDALEHDLLIKHLEQLKQGVPADVPQYDYAQHNRKPETTTMKPSRLIILEGFLILHNPVVRELLDLKIFVDVSLDICLVRRLRRDIQERGRSIESVLKQYEETVRPMYFQFIEPTKRYADIIVPRGGNNRSALDVLADHLVSELRPA